MKRLIKLNNHVGILVREDIIKDILDGDRTKRRNSSDSYLIAKQLVMDSVLTPSNENIIAISQDIDSGKYSDLGKSKENWDAWVNRTQDIFREKKILLANKGEKKMKRLIKKSDAKNLMDGLSLNAIEVMNQIQNLDKRLSIENILSDTNAQRNAIIGYVDDLGDYVLEIYSYKNEFNAIVVAKLENGVPTTNYDIQIKEGSRIDIKNNILSNGYTLSTGEKLTFNNKNTTIPEKTEENN
jgi:hypothetical protein